MSRYINSDVTMEASQSFELILDHVKHSCLNFRMHVTPFSAEISLKKTLVKDMNGLPKLPTQHFHSGDNLSRIQTLETELVSMKEKYEKLVVKYDIAEESLVNLTQKLKVRDETIQNLKMSNLAAMSAAEKVKKALIDKVDDYSREKAELIKEYEDQVTVWRKEFIKADEKHTILEKKFDMLEIDSIYCTSDNHAEEMEPPYMEPDIDLTEFQQHENVNQKFINACSICAIQIFNRIPEYFCGEVVAPICDECKRYANLSDLEQTFDPFSSFPASGIPISLISHWIPPLAVSNQSFLSIPSLRAHYVQTLRPGDTFISMEEMLYEMKVFVDKQCKKLDEQCQMIDSKCAQS